MYLLFSIVFIAELIIASALIYWIVKIDHIAKNYTKQWIVTEQESIKLIQDFRSILKSAQKTMDKTIDFVKKKKREFKRKLINLDIIYAILIVFKLRFRRAALLLQYIILAQDVWKSIPI